MTLAEAIQAVNNGTKVYYLGREGELRGYYQNKVMFCNPVGQSIAPVEHVHFSLPQRSSFVIIDTKTMLVLGQYWDKHRAQDIASKQGDAELYEITRTALGIFFKRIEFR